MKKKKNKQPYQFSKIIVTFAILFSTFFLTASLALSVIFRDLDPMITSTLIGSCGVIMATTFVWYFKKAQAENSVKLYVSAYKTIIAFRQRLGLETEDLCNRIEEAIIQNLDDVSESHMDNANEPIEKVEVNG